MLCAGFLVLGFGAVDARAGGSLIPLPTTLDSFVNPNGTSNGNFTTVTITAPFPNGETDKFSDFTFSSSAIPPTTPVLTPAGINVSEFHAGIEGGLEFSGAFVAPAGTTVDYKISYVVTAPPGGKLYDALLGVTYNSFGGTGQVSVGESLFNAANGAPLGSLNLSNPPGTPISTSISFDGVQSILVKKDILMLGGSMGAGLSVVDQGFSSSVVPEPASWALLGIGMTGFLAFRRFFKKPSVA
jgi:hypothetical protein